MEGCIVSRWSVLTLSFHVSSVDSGTRTHRVSLLMLREMTGHPFWQSTRPSARVFGSDAALISCTLKELFHCSFGIIHLVPGVQVEAKLLSVVCRNARTHHHQTSVGQKIESLDAPRHKTVLWCFLSGNSWGKSRKSDASLIFIFYYCWVFFIFLLCS